MSSQPVHAAFEGISHLRNLAKKVTGIAILDPMSMLGNRKYFALFSLFLGLVQQHHYRSFGVASSFNTGFKFFRKHPEGTLSCFQF